ncbi:MAG TPA: DUF1501 domain-containing protein [Thermoanaerobaculia bacterium]|nr:DUF1501 domain-containing protein [Thermoanaerobaculia bacterium]
MRPFDRRSFLKALGALSLPAWFPRLAFSTAPDGPGSAQRDLLVCVFQRGAADGLNTIVPVGDSAYYANRPTIAIPEPAGGGSAGGTSPAIDLDGFFALHPALAPLKPFYDDKALAAVHATGSPDPTHSHFQAMDYMERGTPGSQAISTGWINRHLQAPAAGGDGDVSPFRAVGFGTLLQASLRGPVPATALQSIADFHLRGNAGAVQTFQASLASLYADTTWLDAQGVETFNAVSALAAANPLAYLPRNGAQYPDSDLGLALRQVAQLSRASLGLEVACVDVGGWDTHHAEGGATGQLATLLGDLAAALAAFATDLGSQMQHVLVVTMSEFGRRVLENASGGTDHGHGNSMLVLGGGVNGGKVYGTWPGLAPGQLASPGDLQVITDFRTVLAEIVDRRLLNSNLAAVFPGFQAPAYLGIVQPAG